jgi:hypothetical protein
MKALNPWGAPSTELMGTELRERNELEPTHSVWTEHHASPFCEDLIQYLRVGPPMGNQCYSDVGGFTGTRQITLHLKQR